MYRHIMVPLDGSKLAECVLPHVEALDGACQLGKVTFIRVVPPLHLREGLEDRIPVEERKRLEDDSIGVAKKYLGGIVNQTKFTNLTPTCVVLFGNVMDKLVEFAEGKEVDLIVIAS